MSAKPRSALLLILVFSAACLSWPWRSTAQNIHEPMVNQPGKDAPWVPTQSEVIEKMLDVAEVTPRDFVIDLGSGDGRTVIAAAKRGARALGVEYNADLVSMSRRLAKEAGVANKATFTQGDMYEADVSKATVLALFLVPENLDKLQSKFLAMKPGTRIVLNTFGVTDWEPDRTESIGAPCKTWCTALLLIVPAQVAGAWQIGKMDLTLKQYYQVIRGTLGIQNVIGRLRGDQITFTAGDTSYTGRVRGDIIEGRSWTARRKTSR